MRKSGHQLFRNVQGVSALFYRYFNVCVYAVDHTEQIETTSGEDHRRRTGRFQSRKEYHRADSQPMHSM